MIKQLILLLTLSLSLTAHAVKKSPFEEGDLIFHQSQSGQAAALREITGSVWTHVGVIVRQNGEFFVAEAARNVTLTPLVAFIERGFKGKFVVKRVRPELLEINETNSKKLRSALAAFTGKGYDVWFQWSDDVIYCSELVWKAYKNAFGVELSRLERFRDFPMNGPEAQRLIRERYTSQGRTFNVDELVISPITLMESESLVDVFRQD